MVRHERVIAEQHRNPPLFGLPITTDPCFLKLAVFVVASISIRLVHIVPHRFSPPCAPHLFSLFPARCGEDIRSLISQP